MPRKANSNGKTDNSKAASVLDIKAANDEDTVTSDDDAAAAASPASTTSRSSSSGSRTEEVKAEETHQPEQENNMSTIQDHPAAVASSSSSSASTSRGNGHQSTDGASESDNGDETADEDEDEDEEPTLRYNRLNSQVVNDLLQKDTCSCLAVSERYLALGSHNGLVTVFSRPGYPRKVGAAGTTPSKGKGRAVNQDDISLVEAEGEYIVKKYRAHGAAIMDIVIDEESQYIGTASMDGKAIIFQLESGEAQAFDLGRPLRCLALEPSYASKSSRQLVSGGMAGNLTLHEKGWLGPKDVVIHSGEGPIWSTRWRRNYIAWANDAGIRIYDTHTSTRIASIARAAESPRADLYPCYLLWQNDSRLVVGWADMIRVVDIRDRRYQQEILKKQQEVKEHPKSSSESIRSGKSVKSSALANPLAGMGSYIPSIGVGSITHQSTYAEVTNVLKLDSMISGIVPFVALDDFSVATSASRGKQAETHSDTSAFIVLSYITDETDEEETYQTFAKPSHPPELRIIDVDSGEELSSDVLSIAQFEKYQCRDYRIVISTTSTSTQASYFATSPTDLIEVKKRDVSDHIAWLCERRRYQEALKVAENEGIRLANGKTGAKASIQQQAKFDVKEIGRKYLEYLFEEGDFQTAARSMPNTLGQDSQAWEDWIFRFVQKGQIEAIIPHIPTSNPKLDHIVYEMVLAHFLGTKPETLLQMLKTWPSDLYESQAVINAIKGTIDRESATSDIISVLMECLIQIYTINKMPGRALPYYLRLRKPGVFELIKQNNLLADINDQVLLLVDFQEDAKRRAPEGPSRIADLGNKQLDVEDKHGEAIALLVDHTQAIPVSRVVAQLQSNRYYLYMYLDALFQKDPQSAYEYSDDLVDLYAEYDYRRLLDCLRASTSYSLEKAYEICKKRDFVPEMVFLLGRMGNNKQALTLIIERLGDVQRAIDFAKEQNDADLWEDLLKYAESKPTFIRGLLENVGPEVDPIRLIRRIKNGLEIPGLKPAIIKILQDFNIQISLIEGCKTILNADCRTLTLELYDGQTNASLGSVDSTMCYKCHKPAFLPPHHTTSTPASATTAEATSIIFLCRHIFHIACALPDTDLPSRPQHFLNPLLAGGFTALTSGAANQLDEERDLASKVLFASQLKSRSSLPVSCPACLAGKGSRVPGQSTLIA